MDDEEILPIIPSEPIECEVADYVWMPRPEDPPGKPGPKTNSKKLVEATYLGLPVGRPVVIVDPMQVYKLATIGCKNTEIADFLGIQTYALVNNFKVELTKGREQMKIILRRAMFRNACVNNSPAVQIFLAKNCLGMSDSPINSDTNTPLPWDSVD